MTQAIAHIANKTITPGNDNYQFIKDGNTDDIVAAMRSADKQLAKYTTGFATQLKGQTARQTGYNIWQFLKENIHYEIDPPGVQVLRMPSQLWKDKKGDCKSFSLFTASILRNLGIPYCYRFTSYKADDPTVTHVYVVVPMRNAPEIIIDAVWKQFDSQKPYSFKKDVPMTKIYQVSGIGKATSIAKKGELNVGDPKDLSESKLDLLIAKQRLEIIDDIQEEVRGIGNAASNKTKAALEVVNDALDTIDDPTISDEDKIKDLMKISEDAVNGVYDNVGVYGVADRVAMARQRRTNRDAREAIGFLKGVGKFFKKVGNGIRKGVKAIAKVVTAPMRLAAKGILEVALPKAAPAFLYLFVTDKSKLTKKGKQKLKKQEKIRDFIVKGIGMKKKHFMGIIRNGIMKKYKKSPESVLRDRGLAGIGAVPGVGAAIQAVIGIIRKIASLFKKGANGLDKLGPDDEPNFSEDFVMVRDARGNRVPANFQAAPPPAYDPLSDQNFNNGGRRGGIC